MGVDCFCWPRVVAAGCNGGHQAELESARDACEGADRRG